MCTVIRAMVQSLAIAIMVGTVREANADQLPDAVTARLQTGEVVIARAWHGKTLRAKADEYQQYLGGRIVNMPKIKGNLGYEFHRLDPPSGDGDYVEFEVVSYWPSLQAVEAFAGADIQAVHDAPRDNEQRDKGEELPSSRAYHRPPTTDRELTDVSCQRSDHCDPRRHPTHRGSSDRDPP
jgi:heme-degrading monooxygenase HmoA